MAVHLPLSIEAQVEAHTLMMSTHNIFAPSNGKPIMSPSQDTVMGCNYITVQLPDQKGEGMIFASMTEAEYAFQQGTIARHAKVKVRLPAWRRLKSEDPSVKGGAIIETTFGRIQFNSILPDGMDFYNFALKGSDLAAVISDCYQRLGRRATIKLLDDMNQLGFRESTRSGLSFGADDLLTPESKTKHIADADKKVMVFQKNYLKGVMTAQERYNQVLDAWTNTRELITKDMLVAMENDNHRGNWYINPVFLMASSGARGGIEQIRQLAGMRGLMAKPTGEIIEAPIKSNFREGLSVLEYFSSTHGARKGLADTALKTADSGYLTRKLADVAQNVVITLHDCETTQGITKGTIYRGEKVEVRLADSIVGRVSRQNIVNLVTAETIVEENQMITREIARKIEEMGLEKIQVRSPMTCDAPLGVCRLCYGMDMSTGSMVEEGMAVGIIAAQSIGEPGTQLTMRTFHQGGTVNTSTEESDIKAKKAGIVKFLKMRVVTNDEGHDVVLTRNCEIAIVDARGRELERYDVPSGARLLVKEDQEIVKGQVVCEWNPHKISIFSTAGGKVVFVDIVEGETLKLEKDPSGNFQRKIMDSRGKFHPQIVIEDEDGKAVDVHYLPEKAVINCTEGKRVNPGTEIAEMPREATGVRDITGGLPRVTEIFEARKPKDPAVVAELDGIVEISKDRKRGKRSILVRSESGEEVEHLVPPGKRFLVHSGDAVKAGQALVEGPMVPHDILRVSGEEAVQQYLVHEVQQVYRLQRVDINDKHIEIIIARMLRKTKITNAGDTSLLAGLVMDRFEFKRVNDHLSKCVKISDPGDTEFALGAIIPRDAFEASNAQCEGLGGKPAKGKKPKPAHGEVQLLGITKAAVQSNSFISAASFQETTKVLTEAALAGKVDRLVGLKENVILGHLIPAGTGFRVFQDSEVSYRKEALEDLVNRGTAAAEEAFPLLNQAPRSVEPTLAPPAAPAPAPIADEPVSDASVGEE
jgi:DNA-directed RNA polymerase subunit beta'